MATAEPIEVRRDLRIVLLGKTGSGKSATGNTIIGKERFLVDQSPSSVTTTSRKEMFHDDNRSISVIDTPGMFDTSMDQQDLDKEIKACIMKSLPGPHVFLLVLSTAVRFTKEEKEVFSWIKKNFGADAGQYTLAVFTHGDTLEGSIKTYIGKNKDLQDVINECKAGYTVFDNETMQNGSQVNELIEKIDQIVERNGGPYNSTKYEEVQKKLESEELWGKVGGYVLTTEVPTVLTTEVPTVLTTEVPTVLTTAVQTVLTTEVPTVLTTEVPTVLTTEVPTVLTTAVPTVITTAVPTVLTTEVPTVLTTEVPTVLTTEVPTVLTTEVPTVLTTEVPTVLTTEVPTVLTTEVPTVITTAVPNQDAGVAAAVEGIGIGSYLLLSGGAAAAAIGRWMKPKPRSDEEK